MDCNQIRHHVVSPPDRPGQWWEVAVAPPGRLVWQQEIRGREWASSTEAVYSTLQAKGICTQQMQPVQSTTVQPTSTPPVATLSNTNAGEGAIGVLLVLGLVGSAVWAWFNKDKDDYADDYHPMADVPELPPVYMTAWTEPQGNQGDGIPSEFAGEFARNSLEFDLNSQTVESANSPGIPQVSAASEDWPPKTIGAAYDPLQPEQDGEFESYRRAIDADGLSPKGNDIIKVMWGATPGRSAAYQAARKRRDDFAKRLDYYRYEEM